MSNQNTYHRAKIWQIGFFAFNNTATNLYMFFMFFISYYATGMLGLGVVLVSTLMTAMRIWDAFTDPIAGYILDKTDGKLGKNRPFIIAGNIIMMISCIIMFKFVYKSPQALKLLLFILVYSVYIIGYTLQCVVTKSAQTCLTNDPKQRPYFSIFDGSYNVVLFAGMQVIVSNIWVKKYGGFNIEFFNTFLLFTITVSAFLSILAIIGLWTKDRTEYFGFGKPQLITFKDYWQVIKNNRAIQMLVVAASTFKLFQTIRSNTIVLVMLYGIVCGNYALSGEVSAIYIVPSIIIITLGMKFIASRLGQRKALLFGALGCIIFSSCLFLLFLFGNPKSMSFTNINLFTIAFITLWILEQGFAGIAGNIVIPMTADCADYETYRSGKYVPGLMGTLFSCVDKIISSFATTIVGLLIATIGFRTTQPTPDTPYSPQIFWITMACVFLLPIFGWLCNIIAMRFYPLTKEKMEEIQNAIAEIKAKG